MDCKATPDAVLLDVWTPQEYGEGHIPGSKNVPLQRMDTVGTMIGGKGTPLFVYCYSGTRRRQTISLLKNLGYEIEPDALDLLQSFAWPGNYIQFKRVISQAAALTIGSSICQETINSILDTEYRCDYGLAQTGSRQINLNQPLDSIKKDIALLILNQEHGNQSAAASRLGISRATLWRLLKDK